MKETIHLVLADYTDKGFNMDSKVAREMLVDQLEDAIRARFVVNEKAHMLSDPQQELFDAYRDNYLMRKEAGGSSKKDL